MGLYVVAIPNQKILHQLLLRLIYLLIHNRGPRATLRFHLFNGIAHQLSYQLIYKANFFIFCFLSLYLKIFKLVTLEVNFLFWLDSFHFVLLIIN